MKDIARRLVALRTTLDMNQSEFAAHVGITQPAMNNYEQALRRPLIDVAIKIQMRTGATLDWIYLGERGGLPARLLAGLPDLSESTKAG